MKNLKKISLILTLAVGMFSFSNFHATERSATERYVKAGTIGATVAITTSAAVGAIPPVVALGSFVGMHGAVAASLISVGSAVMTGTGILAAAATAGTAVGITALGIAAGLAMEAIYTGDAAKVFNRTRSRVSNFCSWLTGRHAHAE